MLPLVVGTKGACLLNVRPINPSGRKFLVAHRIAEDMYLECYAPVPLVLRRTITLVERCGRDPSEIFLRFES